MENPQIFNRLCAITKEIGAIGKNKRSPGVTFAFRGVDDVMNALHPLLAEYGVVMFPDVLDMKREERLTSSGKPMIYTTLKVAYHFVALDGSEFVATVIGEGMDLSDKSATKAMAIAYKYVCFQVFCIPTEEMAKADPDNYMPEASTISEEQLLRYIENCDSIEDLRDLANMYEGNIKSQTNAMNAYQSKKAELKGGAK